MLGLTLHRFSRGFKPINSRHPTKSVAHFLFNDAKGRTHRDRLERLPPARARREEPHPPMVCVKLPKSVLGLFHLFRATKLPLLGIEVQADESL